MTHPNRLVDAIRYDQQRGMVAVTGWDAATRVRSTTEYRDPETLSTLLQTVPLPAAACLAGYGLALAAHIWHTRPSEAQRGAIIQAGQMLQNARPYALGVRRVLEQALALVDLAILEGMHAESTLLQYIEGECRRADKIAERCGRQAAGLLDTGDHLLVDAQIGPALEWVLWLASNGEQKTLTLAIEAEASNEQVSWVLHLAEAYGVQASPVDLATSQLEVPTLCLVAAELVAIDGSIVCGASAARCAAYANSRGVALYTLGYDGPDQTTATVPAEAPNILPAEWVRAIVMSRGVYRPAMITRALGDGEPPLDVIPLGV